MPARNVGFVVSPLPHVIAKGNPFTFANWVMAELLCCFHPDLGENTIEGVANYVDDR